MGGGSGKRPSHASSTPRPTYGWRCWTGLCSIRSPFSARIWAAGLAKIKLGRLIDGGHVLFAVPGVYRFVEVGGGGLGERQAKPLSFGSVQHEANVLTRQVRGEARRELLLDHHLALHLRVRYAQRSALDDLEELRGVDVEGPGESHCLGQSTEETHDPAISHELEAAASAGRSEPQGIATHRVKDRLASLADLVGPRGEHDQLSLLGGLLGSKDGRIDVVNAVLVSDAGETLVALNSNRT